MGAAETKLLFREDAYSKTCQATIVACNEEGIQLDQTVFYGRGGGQPGDTGLLKLTDGSAIEIVDTVKSKFKRGLMHIPASPNIMLAPGTHVVAAIDWQRRYQMMRMHSCLHLLSAIIGGAVTGGQVGFEESRLDFDLPEANLDKSEINTDLNSLVKANHQITPRWVPDDELSANPALVKTMSVKPPEGAGMVRLIDIAGVDLQACGGTHVARTGEIGFVEVTKIKNKGRHNRRVTIALAEQSHSR